MTEEQRKQACAALLEAVQRWNKINVNRSAYYYMHARNINYMNYASVNTKFKKTIELVKRTPDGPYELY